jgi:hypothetical protein
VSAAGFYTLSHPKNPRYYFLESNRIAKSHYLAVCASVPILQRRCEG